jgi:hypothetical protein
MIIYVYIHIYMCIDIYREIVAYLKGKYQRLIYIYIYLYIYIHILTGAKSRRGSFTSIGGLHKHGIDTNGSLESIEYRGSVYMYIYIYIYI